MAISAPPTQNFVPVKEVRDGVMILKDGSLRVLLIASSVNMALKGADEQAAIITQFQNFLNTLDFSVQIFVQSRRYDVRPYIALLEEKEKVQVNDLLKIQTREYIKFIKNFTDQTNIMTKAFFLVVPYTPTTKVGKSGLLDPFFKKSQKAKQTEKLEQFTEHLSQVEQRANVVIQGLARTGVRTVRLGTEETIEVLYRMFNPGDQEKPLNPLA